METFTNTQRILLIGILVISFAVTHKYVIFAFVYFTAFACAYIFSNALLKQNTPFHSAWVVRCVQYLTTIMGCLTNTSTGRNKDKIHKVNNYSQSHTNQCPSFKYPMENPGKSSLDKEIHIFVAYIIRDFILTWFNNLSSDTRTVQESGHLLRSMFAEVKKHCEKLDKSDTFENFVTLFLSHLHDYQLSIAHFQQQPKYRKRRDKERKEFRKLRSVEDCFDVLGKFHEMASLTKSHDKELNYWHCWLDVILKESGEKYLVSCLEAKYLLLDIVSCQVFLPLVNTITDTHWLHKAIILLTSDDEIEIIDGVESKSPANGEGSDLSLVCTEDAKTLSHEHATNISNEVGDSSKSIVLESQQENIPICPESAALIAAELPEATESRPMFYVDESFQDCQSDSEEENIDEDLLSDHDLPERDLYIPDGSAFEEDSQSVVTSQNIEGRTDSSDTQDVSETVSASGLGPINLFEEVKIAQTENMKEAGGNGTYTMYSIHVTSWVRSEAAGHGWRLQEITVRRRYREFLTLHERLGEHPVYKQHIKGIKGPTRWNFLGKLDQETVRKRQIFLESYLQKLTVHEALGWSMALREFLAYDGDANIAFVKKASHSIDQVLVKTVSGVFEKLSSAFESKEDISRSRSNQKLRIGSLTEDEVQSIAKISNLNFEFSFDLRSSCEFSTLLTKFVNETNTDILSESPTMDEHPPRPDDSDQFPHSTESLPLVQSVVNLALCSISSRETWTRKHHAVQLFRILLGQALEFWLQCEIEDITTKERFVYYMQKLRDTLWPHGELDRLPSQPPSEQQKQHTENQARRCLHNFFPRFLPHVVGNEEFEAGIEEILSCISHPRLNRSFVYRALDWLLGTLYPALHLPEIQTALLNQDPVHRQSSVAETGQ